MTGCSSSLYAYTPKTSVPPFSYDKPFAFSANPLLPPLHSVCIEKAPLELPMATMKSSFQCHDQIPLCSEPLSLKKYHGRFGPSSSSSSSVAANRRMGRSRNLTISARQGEAQNKAELSNSRTRSQVSTTVVPPTPFPPPQPQFGSPILWIGVGVGISIVFSWAAKKVQSYAMQQALKAMMEQSGQGGNPFMAGQGTNPFGGQGRTPFMAGQGSNPFGGQGVNPFAGMPPASFPVTPPPPPTSPAASSTVDVTHSTVSPPQSEAKLVDEKPVEKPMSTRRVAFTDVEVNTLVEDKTIAQDQPSPQDSPPKPSFTDPEVVDNNTSFSGSGNYASQDTTTQNGKTKSFISVEMLETMLDDPKVQQMVFPYLPEEMRDPVTFKRMIQLPQVRQQLQEALNNMGGDDGLDMLKYMNSDAVKQQFEQIGLTPEEVVGKILASPDIAASLQNPKVVEAIMDCSQNPLNITKYQNDQEVMNALLKIAELFPGATSSPY